MRINNLQYNERHQALEIYIPGCDGYCKGCHNDVLFDFNNGKEWRTFKEMISEKAQTCLVKRIWVMGGEPLLNDIDELEKLFEFLSGFNKELWLWTRFNQERIPGNIIGYLSYAKTGEYNENLSDYEEDILGIRLASLNQRIIDLGRALV